MITPSPRAPEDNHPLARLRYLYVTFKFHTAFGRGKGLAKALVAQPLGGGGSRFIYRLFNMHGFVAFDARIFVRVQSEIHGGSATAGMLRFQAFRHLEHYLPLSMIFFDAEIGDDLDELRPMFDNLFLRRSHTPDVARPAAGATSAELNFVDGYVESSGLNFGTIMHGGERKRLDELWLPGTSFVRSCVLGKSKEYVLIFKRRS